MPLRTLPYSHVSETYDSGSAFGSETVLPRALREVGQDVPGEVVRAATGVPRTVSSVPSFSRRRAVQVEQNEAGAVAPADVVDDLVLRLLVVDRRVDAEAVVQEAELSAELVRFRELRLEQRVRTGEAVAVPAVGRRLRLERRAVRVRPRIPADFGIRRAELSRHVLRSDGNASEKMKLAEIDG